MLRQNNRYASVLLSPVSSQALPIIAGRLQKGIFRYKDRIAGRSINFLVGPKTGPPRSVGPFGSISVLGDFDLKTFRSLHPVATVAIPASPIAAGMRVRRGGTGIRLREDRKSKRSNNARQKADPGNHPGQ